VAIDLDGCGWQGSAPAARLADELSRDRECLFQWLAVIAYDSQALPPGVRTLMETARRSRSSAL